MTIQEIIEHDGHIRSTVPSTDEPKTWWVVPTMPPAVDRMHVYRIALKGACEYLGRLAATGSLSAAYQLEEILKTISIKERVE